MVKKEDFLKNLVREEQKYYKNRVYGTNEMETRYYFVDRRINQKYIQICKKYEGIKTLDWNWIFSECVELVITIINNMKKDYLYISADERKDDISYIITTLEQRVDDSINQWTGAYRDRSGGADVIVDVEFNLSIDEVVSINEFGHETTRADYLTDNDNIFHFEKTKSDKEIDEGLNQIYKDCNLTDRRIEVLQALERTQDNYNNREIYTRVHVSEDLGMTDNNVRQTFLKTKKKILDTYNNKIPRLNDPRQQIKKSLLNLIENLQSEKDVINFVIENQEENFMYYILYDRMDNKLVKHFNNNKDNDLHSETMKEFCTYFIKEVYNYIELMEYNDSMSQIKRLPIKKEQKKSTNNFIDSKVYEYIREDKATNQQKRNRYITIESEKYYLIDEIVKENSISNI